jgi:CRISPR-associated endonuclease/helicase Cas3
MKEFDADAVWGKSDGKSLLRHTEDCLIVYRNLSGALPMLPSLTGLENFFDLLFCAVYLHDWGKAHKEFQKVLKQQKNQWCRNRHEIFSVPFAEMLPFDSEQKELISQAVLGHHKDFEAILHYFYSDEEIEAYRLNPVSKINPADFKENFLKCLDFGYLKGLKIRLPEYYAKYAPGSYRFEFGKVDFSSQENPIKTIADPYLAEHADPEGKKYWQQMLLSGAVKICDHAGSAELTEMPLLTERHFDFLSHPSEKWYEHQEKCGCVKGNLFLTAPTGSGKTEAALLWLRKQFQSGHQGRIFYILPYTASINAMHRRLINLFEAKGVTPGNTRYIGILHGKLSQYLAEFFEQSDADSYESSHESKARLKKIKDMHRQMVHPLKIVTPFQILKYCYGVKGFEKGFAELAGAMLIFDEIHAYDTRTFAQIAASLKWMRKHLGIRVMIMTATLPEFMLKELQEAVSESEMIKADQSLAEQFTRHRAEILEGTIFDQIPKIREILSEERRVIVVCNTVANAQEMFCKLNEETDSLKSVLIHSRFTAEDRMKKEKILFEQEKEIQLLVGTQAIEVSLDIDFDCMFTEPAPLDALIQRFGRINRRRRKEICPVYVCEQGGENDRYIYPENIVKKTLEVLNRVSVIKEKELQEMLDEVYPECPEQNEYDETKAGFTASLSRLKPFMRDKEDEDAFYKQFSGIPVLPAIFQETYENLIRQFDFAEAERLSVTLHRGVFHKLLGKDIIEKNFVEVTQHRGVKLFPYRLAKCRYDSETGLSEEEIINTESTLFL